MKAMLSSPKTMIGIAVAFMALNTASTSAQSQPGFEPTIQIDARIVRASRDMAQGLDVAWGPINDSLSAGLINAPGNLEATLTAMERAGQGRVLASPRLTTQNNQEAEIVQGVQVPVQTIANNTVRVEWRDAGLRLSLRPQVTPSKTVTMNVAINGDLSTLTRVAVANAGTLVIRGLDLGLGANDRTSTQTLIFITPRIVE